MKSALLIGIFALTIITAESSNAAKFLKFKQDCSVDRRISHDIGDKIEAHEDVPEAEAKIYLACYYKKLGILNSEGKLNQNAIKGIQGSELTIKQLDCLVDKDSLENTAYHWWKCNV